MKRGHLFFFVFFATGLIFGFCAVQPLFAQSDIEAGIVIEEVHPGSILMKAGLQAGDVLRTWTQSVPRESAEAGGELRSPFEWRWLEVERAPRGTIRFQGTRQGEARTWAVEQGWWKAEVRPVLFGKLLQDYLEGRRFITAGNLERGAELWQALATSEEGQVLRAWLFLEIGEAWEDVRDREKTYGAYRRGLAAAATPEAKAAILVTTVLAQYRNGDFGVALENAQKFRELAYQYWPDSLVAATSFSLLGMVSDDLGNLDQAVSFHEEALAIRRVLAPDSLPLCASLNNLAKAFSNRGRLEEAADLFSQVVVLAEKLAPESYLPAIGWSNMGFIAQDRGQLDEAVQFLQNGLDISRAFSPGNVMVAQGLQSLGGLFRRRAQHDKARDYYRQALDFWEKNHPKNVGAAVGLNGLGDVAYDTGDFGKAEEFYREAMLRWERYSPGCLGIAENWNDLGLVAQARGDLDVAAAAYERALEIQQKLLAPTSLRVAATLAKIAWIAHEQGDLDRATELYEQSLATRQKGAPDSRGTATNLNGLARVAHDRGELDAAEAYFNQSLDVLERQISLLGGSQDVKSAFRTRNRDLYLDAINFFLRNGRSEQAFTILERSRARGFLAMLQERELIFRDIPDELDLQRRNLAHRHDRTLQRMVSLNPEAKPEKMAALQAEIQQLYLERDALREAIRRASPNLAKLEEPQPLPFEEVRDNLDGGTVMLSYSVGQDRTHIFAITRGRDIAVHALEVSEKELREEVQHLREAIEGSISGDFLGERRRQEVGASGSRLYQWLVEPVEDVVESGERVVLVPDGPLHRLPFAALVRRGQDGRAQYLADFRPLHSVLSATVYADLKQSRRTVAGDGSGPLVAAFGDPSYPGIPERRKSVNPSVVRSVRDRCGFDVERLPASRREVLEIAGLHRNVQTYLGDGAREESIKSLNGDAKIVHIAAHGCFDDQMPLNSGLFLALPDGTHDNGSFGERDNGLLQAWEIFESVRLDADLVVLSACQSGLGQELGGEGLIGLTRAFQYAGAQTVAATLWQVDDQVTAELMLRFYRHLRAGKPKDAALRAAQVELVEGPIEVRDQDGRLRLVDASSPYYWAAFQLHGDWK